MWLYILLAGAPLSAVRAGIMASLWIGAHMAGRPGSALHSLFLAAAFMTAASPSAFRKRWGVEGTPERIAAKFEMALEAMRKGLCDGAVTYCLPKEPGNPVFEAVKRVILKARTQAGALWPRVIIRGEERRDRP